MNLNIVHKACIQSSNKSPNDVFAWLIMWASLNFDISSSARPSLAFLSKVTTMLTMPSDTISHTTLFYYHYHTFHLEMSLLFVSLKNNFLSPQDSEPCFSSLEKAFCLVSKCLFLLWKWSRLPAQHYNPSVWPLLATPATHSDVYWWRDNFLSIRYLSNQGTWLEDKTGQVESLSHGSCMSL